MPGERGSWLAGLAVAGLPVLLACGSRTDLVSYGSVETPGSPPDAAPVVDSAVPDVESPPHDAETDRAAAPDAPTECPAPGVVAIASDQPMAGAIAVDSTSVYYLTDDPVNVRKVDLCGRSPPVVLAQDPANSAAVGLAIDSTYAYWVSFLSATATTYAAAVLARIPLGGGTAITLAQQDYPGGGAFHRRRSPSTPPTSTGRSRTRGSSWRLRSSAGPRSLSSEDRPFRSRSPWTPATSTGWTGPSRSTPRS